MWHNNETKELHLHIPRFLTTIAPIPRGVFPKRHQKIRVGHFYSSIILNNNYFLYKFCKFCIFILYI